MKQLAVLLASAFMLCSVGLAIAGSGETPVTDPNRSEEVSATQNAGESQRQIMVYYFHGARRCKTCLLIENTAHDIVSSLFAKELEGGEMAWKTVNYDEPDHNHFLKDFGLVSSSLVIVEMKDGEPADFEILQEAWSLARDKRAFEQYIEQSMLKYLGSAG